MLKKSITGIVTVAIVASAVSTPAFAESVKVKKGDTLYSIARDNNVSVNELKTMNGLTSNVIYVGQVLKTSGKTTVSSTVYTVKAGDTLWGISRSYKVSVADLKSWNKLSSNTLRVGQKLKITATAATTPKDSEKPAQSNSDTVIYEVRRGDTLWSISKRYNLTVDQLRSLNGLSNNIINVGQKLKVVKKVIFIRPSEGRVTSEFGLRSSGQHYGIDIAQSGTVDIKAAADGTVSRSYLSKTYGEVVFIVHSIDGKTYETVYAHMKSGSRTVKEGDKVKQGQRIGYMGSTGNSTGQHLHFELHDGRWNYDKTNAVDPLHYID